MLGDDQGQLIAAQPSPAVTFRGYTVYMTYWPRDKRQRTRDGMTVMKKGKLNFVCWLGRLPLPSYGLDAQNAVGWGDTQLLPTGWIFKMGKRISLRAKFIMNSVLYNAQCTILYRVSCTIHSVMYYTQCTVRYPVYCTIHIVLYYAQCDVIYTVYCRGKSGVRRNLVVTQNIQ